MFKVILRETVSQYAAHNSQVKFFLAASKAWNKVAYHNNDSPLIRSVTTLGIFCSYAVTDRSEFSALFLQIVSPLPKSVGFNAQSSSIVAVLQLTFACDELSWLSHDFTSHDVISLAPDLSRWVYIFISYTIFSIINTQPQVMTLFHLHLISVVEFIYLSHIRFSV
jgi:hypothetical protein